MLSTAEAQARIAELEQEAITLEAAAKELETQRIDAEAKSHAAGVTSERTPSPKAAREADQADAAARLALQASGRKRAALAACQADLVTARANLELAQKAATVEELEGFYGELVDIAAKLDVDILDTASWSRMATVLHQGNGMYNTVLPSDVGYYRKIFVDANLVFDRVIIKYRATIAKAIQIGPTPRQVEDIKFVTVADALELDTLRRQLDHLRKVHITDHEQAPAPVLEAVPA